LATSVSNKLRQVYPWEGLPDEALLDLRFCELGLTLKGTELERLTDQLCRELRRKGLRFCPHFWISHEWFVEDYIPGIAIPFYLVHPRLKELERKMMLEVEGGTHRWCLQILRHEAGHALENAYLLRRRKKLQSLFGPTTTPYPNHYFPKACSKDFVVHLRPHYAQCHPDEDFAETFAVWLTPGLNWRARYAGWPGALKKLEYMEELMEEIAGEAPPVDNRRQAQPVSRLKRTLRQHYDRRRAHFGLESPEFLDEDLKKLVGRDGHRRDRPTAAAVLRRIGPSACREVARYTGEYQYVIGNVVRDMIRRSRELGLRVQRPLREVEEDFRVLLTKQTMDYIHSGRHRVAI
jgi:hypothetical protein